MPTRDGYGFDLGFLMPFRWALYDCYITRGEKGVQWMARARSIEMVSGRFAGDMRSARKMDVESQICHPETDDRRMNEGSLTA